MWAVRVRGVEIVGAVAVLGIVALFALTLWPSGTTDTTAGTDDSTTSVLGTPRPTTGATSLATPEAMPAQTPEPTAAPTVTESETDDDTPPATAEPPAELAPDERASVALHVVNGGGQTGAAGTATAALAEQSFQPREAADAVATVETSTVLYRDGQDRAARTVADVLQLSPDEARVATEDDPNWAAFGADLDVLVVLGPPIP